MVIAHYYNEFDADAATWLRQLIHKGMLPAGDVDERDIRMVKPDDLKGYVQHHFFAGIGGWPLALRYAGWPVDRPVWTASMPCQPWSNVGIKKGREDERHLAPKFLDLLRSGRPEFLFGEQVASAEVIGKADYKGRRDASEEPEWTWFDSLSDELEEALYAITAADLPATGVGAPHKRQRLVFGAVDLRFPPSWLHDSFFSRLERHPWNDCSTSGWERSPRPISKASLSIGMESPPPSTCNDRANSTNGFWREADWLLGRDGRWRCVEPGSQPMGDGIPERVVLLKGYGNAIVPQVCGEFVIAFENSVRESLFT